MRQPDTPDADRVVRFEPCGYPRVPPFPRSKLPIRIPRDDVARREIVRGGERGGGGGGGGEREGREREGEGY